MIDSAGPTGVYFQVGNAVCRLVAKEAAEGRKSGRKHGIRCAAPSTGGSNYNIGQIKAGELDFGVAQSDWQFHAYNGSSVWKGKQFKKLRAVFSIHPEPLHIMAGEKSGITSWDGLKGKRVNIGNPGSGQRGTMDFLMKEYGWNKKTFKIATELTSTEQSKALCDGKIDAFIYTVGVPNAGISAATDGCGARIVNFDNALAQRLVKARLYYAWATIPKGTYKTTTSDVKTFGVMATFVTSADVPDQVVAAFIPAVISYMALLYISHLEALKLGLKGMPAADIPALREVFPRGVHFLVPIVVLVWLLMVERWTAGSAVFYSIMLLMVIIVGQHVLQARAAGSSLAHGVLQGVLDVRDGLIAGARNMVGISVAVAAAGIIVGSVASTGLNNAMVSVVEAISGGNVYILLLMTAVLCIFLGMGLPTTANYLVVASLLAGVLVELGNAAGLVLPLIAVHLFVFYFGLLADSTPPVCLAAFAASAISGADPLKTGVQAFLYDIRTAILPFVFIFNPELLLIGVTSIWHGLLVFGVSLLAILCFTSLTQFWMFERLRWYEALFLLCAMVGFFRPDFVLDRVYPAFAPVDIARATSGQETLENGVGFRIHIVRETDYGDRFKLFRFTSTGSLVLKDYGIELSAPDGGRYPIANVAFDSAAARKGLRAYEDFVTAVDIEQLDRPAKEWIYPLSLLVLGLAILSQLMRRRPGKEV